MDKLRPSPHPHLFAQKTIARPVAISGVGIHSGKPIRAKLTPAPADTGIVFRRVDCGGVQIPALASEVSSVELATTLGRDHVTISTVEHLLGAVRMCDIDNLWIDLDGPEVPILDGSALPFLHLLGAAGLRLQHRARRILAVTAPVTVSMGGRSIRISPFPGLRVSYAIDFAHPAIGHQEIDLPLNRDSFERELAPARTFALLGDVERLHRRGLGLGGDLDNCVIFGLAGPTNTALRFSDEPVRHKALDAIGDLALAGAPVWGHLEVERGGHQVHFSLLEALRERPDCWTWLTGQPRPLALSPSTRKAPFPAGLPEIPGGLLAGDMAGKPGNLAADVEDEDEEARTNLADLADLADNGEPREQALQASARSEGRRRMPPRRAG